MLSEEPGCWLWQCLGLFLCSGPLGWIICLGCSLASMALLYHRANTAAVFFQSPLFSELLGRRPRSHRYACDICVWQGLFCKVGLRWRTHHKYCRYCSQRVCGAFQSAACRVNKSIQWGSRLSPGFPSWYMILCEIPYLYFHILVSDIS